MHRRQFSKRLAAAVLGTVVAPRARAAKPVARAGKPTDIAVKSIKLWFEDFKYRTPVKIRGTLVDRVTLSNVAVAVTTGDGRSGKGFGSMPLGNVWAFGATKLGYEQSLGAMKRLAAKVATITSYHQEYGHPVDIYWALESQYLRAADEITRQMGLAEPIPKLCTLMAASPFDAALHDAFGKVHGVSSYQTYTKELMTHDLSHYLGPDFKGEWLGQYLLPKPRSHLPVYHLVSAADPITPGDLKKRLDDGLPETLGEWIAAAGVNLLKIKLGGDDLAWDVERVGRVEAVASEALSKRGVKQWNYSLDFDERCPNVGYLMDFLGKLKSKSPAALRRSQYVEQPTNRDLQAHAGNVMHQAAKQLPVIIDESLTDLDSLMLAREMGYSGIALKACKGQSQALLLAAAAQKYKMLVSVQDLTFPGASLVHSAGLAARMPGVTAIEASSRQYVPAANKGWEKRFPGVFEVADGRIATGVINGPGLGAV
jgi:L-alanine-DL-glutamate epimerase-like enolase superfamily enzyme